MSGSVTRSSSSLSAEKQPVVVSIHRPDAVSGVSSVGARFARLGQPFTSWIPLVIGPESRDDRRSPLRSCPGFSRVSWADSADPIEQCLLVRERLRELCADVVIPNDLPQGFVAAALDAHAGRRIAALVHGDDHDWDELMLRVGPLVHAWAGVNTRIIARTIAVSSSLPHPFGVLTGCVDVPTHPIPMDSASSPSDAPLRLVYAGRLEKKHKRVLDLVALADALHARDVPFVLSVVGEGPAEAELSEKLWPHVRAGRANLLGPVTLDMIHRLARANHMLVLTSESEGAPTAAMEAMAHGRPVAASSGCGLASELIRDGVDGIVFPVGNIEAVAHRLEMISKDRPWLDRAGRAAHALALKHFAPPVVGARAESFVRGAFKAMSSIAAAQGSIGTVETWNSIVRTLHLVGQVSTDSLKVLSQQWLRDRHEADPGLRFDDRPMPSREGRMLLDVIARLSTQGVRRVALYGAGWHTRKVGATLESIPGDLKIVAIVDDRAGQDPGPPSHLASHPVVTPSQAISLGLDAIIISSDEHEREMIERAKAWARGVPIVPIYRAA